VAKEQLVEHPGIIEKIEDDKVFVRIESRSACGNCQSKSYCGMSEMQEKIVEIHDQPDNKYRAGQQVNVVLEESLGYKALLLAYLIPFVILIGGIILTLSITGNEPLAALTGLCLMLPYYFWLYHSRDKLRKTFHFRIRTNLDKF
jgi:sigma-E factor negative regulatory protein RseC